jgi:[protein]-arginine 3-hydroxylase / protease
MPDWCSLFEINDAIVDLMSAVGRSSHRQAGRNSVNIQGYPLQVTQLHYDSMDNFLCQVAGVKYVRLYARREARRLYVQPPSAKTYSASSQGNVSAVDVMAPDLDAHPLFADAECLECVLRPGEVLFMPAKWWHFVTALTTSISVNFWF